MLDALPPHHPPVLSPTRVSLPGWAWLGIGSNVGNRWAHLRNAIERLDPWVQLVSPIYETEPWGVLDQPPFLNGVLLLRWDGSARALLGRCKAVEDALGREKRVRNGPREIDLDLLVLGTQHFDEPDITLPHPGIPTRRSVIEPWSDLAPSLRLPDGTPLARLREELRDVAGQGAWSVRWPDEEALDSARWRSVGQATLRHSA